MAANCADLPLACCKMMPSGRARNVSRSQIRLGGVCFLVTTRTEIESGEAKVNVAPASCSLQIFAQVRDSKVLLSYLFAITFQGLLEIWRRRI